MKKVSTYLLYCFFLLLLVEFGLGQLGYRLTQGRWHIYEDSKKERNEIIAASTSAERTAANIDDKASNRKRRRTEILHPYTGYIVDFHDETCPDIGFCDDRMRSYQSLLQGQDFPMAAPDRAIVVITGGSFAYGVANNSSKGKIEQALASIPELQGKEILIYTLALGGYKQPQQLFALQYYLAMGAHFDMIINIDGFNEIVLPVVENLPFHTNPFFPRVWHSRVKMGTENYQEKMFQGVKTYLTIQRKDLAESANKALFRRSALRGLIWKLQDAAIEKKLAKAEVEYLENVQKAKITRSKLVASGTKFQRDDPTRVYTQLAEFWRQSSVMIDAVAKAHHIKYYHFLQPNQYVADAKPMSKEERAVALLEGSTKSHPYARPARQGYPALIAQGAALKQSGVNYWDLTMMFKDTSEVMYRDACCHLNAKGYDAVIDSVVAAITTKETTARQNN